MGAVSLRFLKHNARGYYAITRALSVIRVTPQLPLESNFAGHADRLV
jgi:hypothetical protein